MKHGVRRRKRRRIEETANATTMNGTHAIPDADDI